ncbi:MAG: type IV pilus twitching motility protein PilT [Planctomycetes bacterium]|nr:type IV pilus twitching motility protein PilT [Planctomycetota bacterium]
MPKIDALFKMMMEKDASDLHLAVGMPIKARIHGELEIVVPEILTMSKAQELLKEIVKPELWERYLETHDLDFAYGIEGLLRLRANYFYHSGGQGAIFRQIPSRIKSIEELKLPQSLLKLADLHSGMVLVTGPTGSGKSTTLASIIDYINRTQKRHIITIEEPIEFVHPNKSSVITQREVGEHAKSFASALKAAVREDPDIILVGEMRDMETTSLAIEAAEMGFLVFGTLHTNNAGKTIDRMIDIFPPAQQDQVRGMLSESLQAVVSQLLLRTMDGKGRVAVNEILFNIPGLANIIREGAISKIYQIIQGGKAQGMQSMDGTLMELVKSRTISAQEAYMKARDKTNFESLVNQ